MIYIGNYYKDRDNNYKKYLVARKEGNYGEWLPELSPSKTLLNQYLKFKDQGIWNKENFDKYYVTNFLYEMKNKKSRNMLNRIFKEGIENDLILMCYCNKEEMCHRSILAGLLQGAAEERKIQLVNCETDYSKYYKMYKER